MLLAKRVDLGFFFFCFIDFPILPPPPQVKELSDQLETLGNRYAQATIEQLELKSEAEIMERRLVAASKLITGGRGGDFASSEIKETSLRFQAFPPSKRDGSRSWLTSKRTVYSW